MTIQIASLVVSVGTLLAGLKLIFMLGRIYEKFEQMDIRLTKVESRVEGLPCLQPGGSRCTD